MPPPRNPRSVDVSTIGITLLSPTPFFPSFSLYGLEFWKLNELSQPKTHSFGFPEFFRDYHSDLVGLFFSNECWSKSKESLLKISQPIYYGSLIVFPFSWLKHNTCWIFICSASKKLPRNETCRRYARIEWLSDRVEKDNLHRCGFVASTPAEFCFGKCRGDSGSHATLFIHCLHVKFNFTTRFMSPLSISIQP